MLNSLHQSPHINLSHHLKINRLHLIHHHNHIVRDHVPPMPITPELSNPLMAVSTATFNLIF